MNYLTLPLGQHAPEAVHAVIEIPGKQSNKYEYDKTLHLFRLDRPLYGSIHYPGDYGFIPSTLAEDGDPLDILVLMPEPTFPGCLVEARTLGALEMLDQNLPDQKVLAVGTSSPHHIGIHNHSELHPHVLRAIEHFFAIYKELEGKRTQVRGWHDCAYAQKLILESHQRFLGSGARQA